jgi:hypothetical protein
LAPPNGPKRSALWTAIFFIDLDAEGAGAGQLAIGVQLEVDTDTNTLKVQSFGTEPVRLTSVSPRN